ncbi:hypothetical protein SDC9_157872 [bioreactor metagenome]|uniref:Uncharacterized protein n=1 Tax=bioreactor metagenome TaxID=1076179 RepID=A0A645F8M0_9ZZZZ
MPAGQPNRPVRRVARIKTRHLEVQFFLQLLHFADPRVAIRGTVLQRIDLVVRAGLNIAYAADLPDHPHPIARFDPAFDGKAIVDGQMYPGIFDGIHKFSSPVCKKLCVMIVPTAAVLRKILYRTDRTGGNLPPLRQVPYFTAGDQLHQ